MPVLPARGGKKSQTFRSSTGVSCGKRVGGLGRGVPVSLAWVQALLPSVAQVASNRLLRIVPDASLALPLLGRGWEAQVGRRAVWLV